MVSLEQIRNARAVAESRSFRRAALLLKTSQATLSRSIQSLEAATGLNLFDRDRQSVRITAVGAAFLDLTAPLLEEMATVEAGLKDLRAGRRGRIRIAAGPIVAQTWIGRAVQSFSHHFANVSVEIEDYNWWDLVDCVRGGSFDLVIGESSEAAAAPDILVSPLPERKLIFVVRQGHRLARLDHVGLADLARYPHVGGRLPTSRMPPVPRESEMGRVSDDGRFFLPKIECSQLSTILDVVSGSDAFCISLGPLVAERMRDGSLIELPMHADWLVTRYAIMTAVGSLETAEMAGFRKAAAAAEAAYFGEAARVQSGFPQSDFD